MRLNFEFPSHSSSIDSRELAVAYPGVAACHGVELEQDRVATESAIRGEHA